MDKYSYTSYTVTGNLTITMIYKNENVFDNKSEELLRESVRDNSIMWNIKYYYILPNELLIDFVATFMTIDIVCCYKSLFF